MRISTQQDDPGYNELAGSGWFEVSVDGQVIPKVFTADEEMGLVIACTTNEAGAIVINDEKTDVVRVEHRGVVEVRVRSDISTGAASIAQRMLDNMRAAQAAVPVVAQAIEPVEPVTQPKRLPKTKA